MKKKGVLIAFIVIFVTIAYLFYSSRKQDNENLKFGVVLSLTGDGSDYGKRSLNGIKWAVEKINTNNGIDGKKIVLVVEDTKSNPKDAVNAINKLINNDNVKIIIGDIISGTTLAMAPVAESHKILLIAPGASNPKMTSAGDYIFRNWTSDEFDGICIANYAIKKGFKKFGIIVQNTEYTLGLSEAFQKEINLLGGRVIRIEQFETGNNNLATLINNFKNEDVDAIYISAYSSGTGLVLKQSKELGFTKQFFATLTVDAPDCEKVAGNLRNGVIYTTPAFNIEDTSTNIRSFVNGFETRYKDIPETSSGHGYDAVNILVDAIKKCGFDIEMIKRCLYDIKNFRGVTGVTSFDENGDVVKNIFVKTFVDNKPVLLEEFSIK